MDQMYRRDSATASPGEKLAKIGSSEPTFD